MKTYFKNLKENEINFSIWNGKITIHFDSLQREIGLKKSKISVKSVPNFGVAGAETDELAH